MPPKLRRSCGILARHVNSDHGHQRNAHRKSHQSDGELPSISGIYAQYLEMIGQLYEAWLLCIGRRDRLSEWPSCQSNRVLKSPIFQWMLSHSRMLVAILVQYDASDDWIEASLDFM